jgi:hypothetical protein
MTELVSGADTDQRPLGSQRGEPLGRYRLSAAMMPDLEHVDVAQSPVSNQGIEHDGLSIPRQHRRETLGLGLQHDTCLVSSGVLDGRTRPHDGKLHSSDLQHVTRHHFTHVVSADQLRRLGHPGRVAVQRARGHVHSARTRERAQRYKPAVVVGVQVGDHHRVQRPDSGST